MHERFASGSAAGALILVLVTAPATPQARQEPPVFGAEVRVVAVPVFVTDKAGRPVADLTAADFELQDDGKKTAIVAFLPVDASEAAAGGEAGSLVQAAARRQLLFLFDLTFSTPGGIVRARQAAAAFVRESLTPSDLAAVATFSQKGVDVLVSFTPDRAQVEGAIHGLGVVESQARMRDVLSIAYDLGLPRWGPGIGPPPADTRADPMAEYLLQMARALARSDQAQYRQRVEGFLAGLDVLARTLDSVQGRKQVILLSAGFDSTVLGGARGQESQEAADAVLSGRLWEVQSDRYFGDSQARDALDQLFRSVARTDTVIHTVDITGLAAGGAVDEKLPQPIGAGRDTLALLANNTGGQFVGGTNDLKGGLDELLERSRRFYVLAFEPQTANDKPDRVRRLKVRVRGDGLTVSHRRGYVLTKSKGAASPASGTLVAAEAIAKGLTGGPIRLHAVAVPYRNARGALSLPVILQADGPALVQGASSKELSLEVFGYAFDAEGQVRDVVTLSPVVDLGAVKARLEGKGLQVITAFAVPSGPVDLRFFVREKSSQRTGSLRLRVEMPASDGDGVVLSPPLAMDDPSTRLVVTAPSRSLPRLEIPFRLAEAPFTAEPRPTLANGVARDVCVMAWGGGIRSDRARDVEFESELVDASGSSHDVPLDVSRLVPDADGVGRYVLTLRPKGIAPGAYLLRMSLYDPASGATGSSELAVQIQ
jgi:VWFA-related protein